MSPSATELKAKPGDVLIPRQGEQFFEVQDLKNNPDSSAHVIVRELTRIGLAEPQVEMSAVTDTWRTIVRKEDRTDIPQQAKQAK